MDQETLELISEEIYQWDGCISKKSMYSSSLRSNIDFMQIVSILTGKRANVREYFNGNPNSAINYQIDVTRQDYALTTNTVKEVVPYSGKVYCVTMPLGTTIVRRNGIPTITGNCQNLPQDKEVRSCFIADPPNNDIRISNCCDTDTYFSHSMGGDASTCACCHKYCETHAEEYKLITIDMSGAELRILAEEANDPIWIKAFNKDEDVHSVCTELVEGDHWKAIAEPGCAYFSLNENGEHAHKKCKCVLHNELRNGMKPTNFGLPYGIGPSKLAQQIKKSVKETKELMEKHKKFFPNIWTYLEKSGQDAGRLHKSFDMFGRRRILPEATNARAVENCREWSEEKLRLPEHDGQTNIAAFTIAHNRKPNKDEEFILTHRNPNAKEIANSYVQLLNSAIRQGKNHRIQSTNASIIKLCMGSGLDKNGKPFLFNILPNYGGKLVKMVHDELVIQVPAQHAQIVAEIVADAIKRAAAEKMKYIEMTSEYHIADYWSK
jgi:hypothetical protein